ncbi:MAG TPA: helix-turn-helix transcriptional regulator [Streptosporangiaceae bacterium]|nr:helix-turn-helix transcriptional regulator [Streptosporangiaceae bacterium]
MGIGGALAAARSEAGLTVDQVSERTRIRATIIRAIERDDYAVCGGDFYARGHIRAIARVVGTDPVPLIEEYDLAHAPALPPPEPPAHRTGGPWLHTLERGPDSASPGAGNGAGSAENGHVGNGWVRPAGITAAEAFRPAMPLQFQGTRRVPVGRVVLSLIVLAAIAGVAYLVASAGARPAAPKNPRASGATAHRGVAHHPAAAHGSAPATARSSPTALPVASATAFGPAGPSQGDNPSMAGLAIDGNNSTAWQTDWYATSTFNGTQPGTGLLLDMGSSVQVSAVELLLGPAAGGTVQLRAGNTPALADLPVVAQAADPGGTLTLQPSAPVTAQYVLIWFTQLPPDGAGTYQAYVYNVSVSGTG